LHDVVCMSDCGPDSDHADRTQSRSVAALRRYLREVLISQTPAHLGDIIEGGGR
jgi:hypothetical protein